MQRHTKPAGCCYCLLKSCALLSQLDKSREYIKRLLYISSPQAALLG